MASRNGPSNPPGLVRWRVSSQNDPSALEFYRNGIKDWYQVSEIDTGPSFFTDNLFYQFGPYVIGRGQSVGQVLVRGPDEIRRSGLDSVAIILDLVGLKGEADGTDVNTPAGTFHLRDLARPSALKVDRFDVIVLAMPRNAAPRWLVDRKCHGLSIDGTPQVSRLLTGHLMALMRSAPTLEVEEGVAGIEAALVMAEQAFLATGRFTTGQAEAAYRGVRASAVVLIDRMLCDPELNIGTLTHALGVSRATLFRAFALSGGIVRYIKRRRLELAHEALRARVERRPTVSQIAHAHGFISESHFSRSFRDHYGTSPGAIEPQEQTADLGTDLDTVRYDTLLAWMKSTGGAALKDNPPKQTTPEAHGKQDRPERQSSNPTQTDDLVSPDEGNSRVE